MMIKDDASFHEKERDNRSSPAAHTYIYVYILPRTENKPRIYQQPPTRIEMNRYSAVVRVVSYTHTTHTHHIRETVCVHCQRAQLHFLRLHRRATISRAI